jgi:hypothetical protein
MVKKTKRGEKQCPTCNPTPEPGAAGKRADDTVKGLQNGQHYRLPDGREFRLCGHTGTERVGRVLVDGGLLTVFIDEEELRDCPVVPYLERTFSYDSRNRQGMIWRTMKRIEDSHNPETEK